MRLLEIIEEGSFLNENVFYVRFDQEPPKDVIGENGGVVVFHVSKVEETPTGFKCMLVPRADDHRAYLELLLFREFVGLGNNV
jgi:hypothetical protein